MFCTIKAKYKSYVDFKENFDPISNFDFPLSEEVKVDFMKTIECFLKKIEEIYQDGDEIWHYDDFKLPQTRFGRECILIKRDNKTIKSFLVRIS